MLKRLILAAALLSAAAGIFAARDTVPPVVDIAQKRGYVVVIDPAHGGGDWGVNARGIMEKDITLKAAKLLKKKLERAVDGITVYLTRDNDSFISPSDRAGFSNSKKADVYISLHCDYSANPQVEGYKVYYSAGDNIPGKKDPADVLDWTRVQLYHIDESVKLAGYVSQYMLSSLIPESGAAGNSGTNSTVPGKYRKEKAAVLTPLEGVDSAAVVVELGNLNNSNDASYLKDDKALNSMAYHIGEAVGYFLKDKK
jgi:N-acetylmuramoyl-L-alanine amidase